MNIENISAKKMRQVKQLQALAMKDPKKARQQNNSNLII
jgi:hypothetical protein